MSATKNFLQRQSRKIGANFNTLKASLDDVFLRGKITHVHGLKVATSNQTLPVVCCLVRDGGYWIPSFIAHYRQLGVKEFFFLNNRSNDETVEILKSEEGVGLYASDAPFKHFNANLRRLLVQVVRPSGWTLGVDIDEYFDYPYSDTVNLSDLCKFLDRSQFNAITTHQLDMASDGNFLKLQKKAPENLKTLFPFYSLEGLKKNGYELARESFGAIPYGIYKLPERHWPFYCNGLRFNKFGMFVWLTKHALFRSGGRLVPYHHPHLHRHMKVANLSGVLYHFKFTPHFLKQIRTALQEKQYFNDSRDYLYYDRKVSDNSSLSLTDPKSRKLNSVNDLVAQGFLTVPSEYKKHFGISA